MADGNPNELTLELRAEDWQKILESVRKNPKILFLSKTFRRLVAVRRAEKLNLPMLVKEVPENSILNTIPHNAVMMPKFLEAHSARLTNALVTIDPIFGRESEASILCIGPRNEMELFLLYGLGFAPANVKAIDLISNSPLISVGDMHAIPYPDSSFDAVLCGWTLSYSRKHQLAVDEMVRVCRPGGLIAVGLSYIPVGHEDRTLTEFRAPSAMTAWRRCWLCSARMPRKCRSGTSPWTRHAKER